MSGPSCMKLLSNPKFLLFCIRNKLSIILAYSTQTSMKQQGCQCDVKRPERQVLGVHINVWKVNGEERFSMPLRLSDLPQYFWPEAPCLRRNLYWYDWNYRRQLHILDLHVLRDKLRTQYRLKINSLRQREYKTRRSQNLVSAVIQLSILFLTILSDFQKQGSWLTSKFRVYVMSGGSTAAKEAVSTTGSGWVLPILNLLGL